MDMSNLYVPDSKKWVDFYWDSYVNRNKTGSQIGGANSKKSSIHPIERPPENNESQTEGPVKIISPAQAVVEQAETEIKRKGLKRKQKCKTTGQSGKRGRGKTKDYFS